MTTRRRSGSIPPRAVWWLVPLQILWVNTQGIFAVGLALICCWWLGATLAFLPVPRWWKDTTGLSFADWRRLTLVLGLATVGCLADYLPARLGLENLPEPLTDQRVIVGQENAYARHLTSSQRAGARS